MSFSDPKVATLIAEAFVPVQVSMILGGAFDDPEGRRIVETYPRSDGMVFAPPDLLVFAPTGELLGQLKFKVGAQETFDFLCQILETHPDLAPASDPLAPYAYDLTDPAQGDLAHLEERWDMGERESLAKPLVEWLEQYGRQWPHGAATALTLLGAAEYHQGNFTAADAAWNSVVEQYPDHPLRYRAEHNLLDPRGWGMPAHADIVEAKHPQAGVDRPIFIPDETVRNENLRRVLFTPHYRMMPSGLPLVRIPAGTFIMGGQPTAFFDRERPLRQVTISKPFWLAAWPVTQGLWRRFRPNALPPTTVSLADEIPMQAISYDEAVACCDYLSQLDGLQYRLPTEAEWEYAARGGLAGANHPWGDEPVAETRCNYLHSQGVPVASYAPNGYGLFEMVGNVWEWTEDYFWENAYATTPYAVTDPCQNQPFAEGSYYQLRVVRGGYVGIEFSKQMMRNAFRVPHRVASLRVVAEIEP